MGGLFGGDGGAAAAAREQAKQTEAASKRQEAAARQQAANAQAQQENLIARDKVQEQIRAMNNVPVEKAEVDLSIPAQAPTSETDLEKRRNPRQQFLSKVTGGGSGISI